MSVAVENTKEIVTLFCEIINCAVHVNKDGSVSLDDIPAIWDVVVAIGPAFEGMNSIPKEISDLDLEELEEITDHVKQQIKTDDEATKAIIAKSLKAASALYDLYLSVRSI